MKSDIDFSDKSLLRRYFAEKRKSKDFEEFKLFYERKITENFLLLPEYKIAAQILLYSALEKEISTDGIFFDAISEGKRLYFPKSYSDGKMEFFRVSNLNEMKIGKFNIREPLYDEKYLESVSDICVIPALSFDKNGYRLGYGGGYYDRFLTSFRGLKIGFCFFDFLAEKLPREAFDIPVDIVITEKGAIRVK